MRKIESFQHLYDYNRVSPWGRGGGGGIVKRLCVLVDFIFVVVKLHGRKSRNVATLFLLQVLEWVLRVETRECTFRYENLTGFES